MLASVSGFLNLYKPAGWTSHDCIAKLRHLLHLKKVGHGGTLDPAAAGVLPIALGRATRLLQFLPSDKAYRAVVRFGITTITDDLEGEVLERCPADHLTESAAIAALPAFVGTLQQVPPRYSAIQVQGQRLYDLARQGKVFEVPSRTVRVYDIRAIAWQPGPHPELTLDIQCGAGTYIRSLARDLGAALGTGATLARLERTKSGGFTQDASLSLATVEAQVQTGTFCPIAPEIALQHLPRLVLTPEAAEGWQKGQKIPYPLTSEPLPSPYYQVYDSTPTFLGITTWEPIPEMPDHTRLRPAMVYVPFQPA